MAAANGNGAVSHFDTSSDKYEVVKELGRGNFGLTMLMRNRQTQELVAAKFIQRGIGINVNVERELLNHRLLLHPHVVRFREVFLTRTHLAIVMDYARAGELFNFVKDQKRLGEDTARFFFQQLISGLEYCHRQGVMHRDLKLENTLLDYGGNTAPMLKICDFGYSKHATNDSTPKSVKGTIAYLAPEVMLSFKGDAKYDAQKSDIWSCGVMLYLMLVGGYPFQSGNKPAAFGSTLKKILKADYKMPGHISAECKDLISRILVVRPACRITLGVIKSHPWFLRNLPKELQEGGFGDRVGTQEGKVQSEAEIRALVQQAAMLGADDEGGLAPGSPTPGTPAASGRLASSAEGSGLALGRSGASNLGSQLLSMTSCNSDAMDMEDLSDEDEPEREHPKDGDEPEQEPLKVDPQKADPHMWACS